MNSRSSFRTVAALAVVAVALSLWWTTRPEPPADNPSSKAAAPTPPTVSNPTPAQPEGPAARLARARAELGSQAKAEDVQTLLARLRDELLAAPSAPVVSALLDELRSGADVPTGLDFRVGAQGNLATWPTWRTWLLDLLGQIDPATAAAHSAEVYARRNSADEWSLAMRNEWRGLDPAQRATAVRERARELVFADDWVQRPTPGFLEGVDASVATLAWEFLPRFEAWLAPESSKELRHAGWIALEKLALENPSDFLPALAANASWLSSQPLIRAGLMARADVGDDRQWRAVDAYLGRSDISAAEASKFFELVPHMNAPIAHTLISTLRVPSAAEAAHRDRGTLAKIREWRADPRLTRWSEQITAADTRLAESVASAVRGGILPP